jgi:hypothetical protein
MPSSRRLPGLAIRPWRAGYGDATMPGVSDHQRGHAWWQASDGLWYPPQPRPGATPRRPTRFAPRRATGLYVGAAVAGLVVAVVGIAVVTRWHGSKRASTSVATSPVTTSTKARVAPTTTPPTAQTFSGTSDQATRSFEVQNGLSIFQAMYTGSGTFTVEIDDLSGHAADIPFDTVGSYQGSKVEALSAGPYLMRVTGVGTWTITVEPEPAAQIGASLPQTYTGTSETAVGPFQTASGTTRMQFHFVGSALFAVLVLDHAGKIVDVAANAVGNYDGSTVERLPASTAYWLNVTGHGSWTIVVGG